MEVLIYSTIIKLLLLHRLIKDLYLNLRVPWQCLEVIISLVTVAAHDLQQGRHMGKYRRATMLVSAKGLRTSRSAVVMLFTLPWVHGMLPSLLGPSILWLLTLTSPSRLRRASTDAAA